MASIDDEPRQHPKPAPFCQDVLLQPVVPEVSLLLQDNITNNSQKKSDSFSGTQFQTYNSWRWQHLGQQSNKTYSGSDIEKSNKCKSAQSCCLIKDKYFTSDLEKRKNEILYGEPEEPRRPLPPRASPVIPISDSFFSNESFNISGNIQKKQPKPQPVVDYNKDLVSNYNTKSYNKETDNFEKLYSIISEQSKQMQIFQKQIEQLLKLQEVKDKQIEQLLKSQEAKEKKNDQLLVSLDLKTKEVEQLLSLKEKQEHKIKELLRMQEVREQENLNLSKKLKELKQKKMETVGVMASTQVTDAGTCTNLDDVRRFSMENAPKGDISAIRENSQFDDRDKSLSLHSSDLPVIQENVPTPQSSIHLDIRDFPESSDDSESETGIPNNTFSTAFENHQSPLGYTFYNNVLTQLNDIIQNSGEKESNQNGSENIECIRMKQNNYGNVTNRKKFVEAEKENHPAFEKSHKSERLSDKYSYSKDTSSPSDISLKINALALKYLKQEQISQCSIQPQIPTSCQHDVTIYNVTNLSFGSMRYLDRYHMLPRIKESQKEVLDLQKNECGPGEFLQRKQKMSVQHSITSSIGNILDLSALNQQPKLI